MRLSKRELTGCAWAVLGGLRFSDKDADGVEERDDAEAGRDAGDEGDAELARRDRVLWQSFFVIVKRE